MFIARMREKGVDVVHRQFMKYRMREYIGSNAAADIAN